MTYGNGVSGLGRDYDAFDLIGTIGAAYAGTPPTGLYPMLYEGITSPAPYVLIAPPNFHLGLDFLNFTNGTAAVATVQVQIWQYTSGSGTPFGPPGPVIFSQSLAALTDAPANTVTVDQSKFRLACAPGFFFVVFSVDGTFSSDFIQVQARGRFTPG